VDVGLFFILSIIALAALLGVLPLDAAESAAAEG